MIALLAVVGLAKVSYAKDGLFSWGDDSKQEQEDKSSELDDKGNDEDSSLDDQDEDQGDDSQKEQEGMKGWNLGTNKGNREQVVATYSVAAKDATIMKQSGAGATTATVADIKVGDKLIIIGTVSGTNITATSILNLGVNANAGMMNGRGPIRGTVTAISGNTVTISGTVSNKGGDDDEGDDNDQSGGDEQGGGRGIGGFLKGGVGLHMGQQPRLLPMKWNDQKEEQGLSKKQVIDRRFGFAQSALDSLYDRLSNIITRLDDNGSDVTDAQAKLVIAKTKITDAKIAIDDMTGLIASIKEATVVPGNASIKSALSDADKTKIQEAVLKTKTALLAARDALKDVFLSIKATVQVGGETEDGN